MTKAEASNQNTAQSAIDRYLFVVRGGPIDQWIEYWSDDAVVEYPYAPAPWPTRIEGKQAIYKHYENMATTMELLEESPMVIYPSADPHIVVFEISLHYKGKAQEMDYWQDYIIVIRTREDGKIIALREFWNAARVLESFQ